MTTENAGELEARPVSLNEDQIAVLTAVLDHEQTVSEALREQLRWNAMLAGEDIGWARVLGGGGSDFVEGPQLEDLQEWSEKLREALGNVHMQRGLRLRTNNIWSGNIHYNEAALPKGSGHKQQTAANVKDPLNRRNFFGPQAHTERESALYTDGVYLVMGDPADWTLEAISISDIGAIYVNPKRKDEIIAYRHDYLDYSTTTAGKAVKEWHYTDLAVDRRNRPGFKIEVKTGETAPDSRVIFDEHVNTQVGWAFGVPDSLTAYAWAKVYRDFVMNGKVMSDAMAQFAYQIATGTKKETTGAAARIAEPSDAGATLIGANTLVPLTTAGKGYDFESGRSLLGIVAGALEVTVGMLGADSKDGGVNAGSLDLATRLAMESRRQLHAELDYRVLVWMGADKAKLNVTFSSLDDSADIYRELQALILALDSGLYEPKPIEKRISMLLEIVGNTVPPDWLNPNTIKALKAKAKIEADAKPPVAAPVKPGEKPHSTASPTQGRSKASGKSGDKGNDIRTDNVGK